MTERHRCRPGLGTFIEISARDAVADEAWIDARIDRAFSAIQDIVRAMSFHDPNSELSHINHRAHLAPCPISSPMQQVLHLADDLHRATNGAYDLTLAESLVSAGLLPDHEPQRAPATGTWANVHLKNGHIHFDTPLRIDLGGIAKGLAVDAAFAELQQLDEAVVNIGGDLRMTPWKGQPALIRQPGRRGRYASTIMHREAMATSSCSEQRHLIDPATRRPLRDKRSISVFASTCLLADALTKVLFLISETQAQTILNSYDAVHQVLRRNWCGVSLA